MLYTVGAEGLYDAILRRGGLHKDVGGSVWRTHKEAAHFARSIIYKDVAVLGAVYTVEAGIDDAVWAEDGLGTLKSPCPILNKIGRMEPLEDDERESKTGVLACLQEAHPEIDWTITKDTFQDFLDVEGTLKALPGVKVVVSLTHNIKYNWSVIVELRVKRSRNDIFGVPHDLESHISRREVWEEFDEALERAVLLVATVQECFTMLGGWSHVPPEQTGLGIYADDWDDSKRDS